MIIVGTGCGPGMLTEKAIEAIKSASLITGSKRALDLVRAYTPNTAEMKVIEDYKLLKNLPDHTVVLSTGDPMLSGLGYLPGEVIPGISSVQYAAAKLKIPLTKVVVITAHGRDPKPSIQEALEMISLGRIVCLITDPEFPLDILAQRLKGLSHLVEILLCADLGYESEEIIIGYSDSPPKAPGGMYILFLSLIKE